MGAGASGVGEAASPEGWWGGSNPAGHKVRNPTPAPPIDDLAAFANGVAFGPAGWATEAQAVRAAAQSVAYVGELRARRPWWRRLLWPFDPRPLLWERRRRRATAP